MSWAFLHRHNALLSFEQLKAVAQGQTIEVSDTVTDHLYKISLAQTNPTE
jgi:hypothetical protein